MTDMNEFNAGIIDEFRANAGVVGGMFEGAPMVLLTTTGARSGAERVTPLVYLDGGNGDGTVYVFASKAGAPEHPAWYHNLVAHPDVTVEIGTKRFRATAAPVDGAERDAIYERQAALRPNFAEYQEKTTRTIPVVALKPG
ncbi:MAG TPA: nitroreductase family deazaflavin-dependent oxidoreductase [Solirubrobacteraceae bacterium]